MQGIKQKMLFLREKPPLPGPGQGGNVELECEHSGAPPPRLFCQTMKESPENPEENCSILRQDGPSLKSKFINEIPKKLNFLSNQKKTICSLASDYYVSPASSHSSSSRYQNQNIQKGIYLLYSLCMSSLGKHLQQPSLKGKISSCTK